jgi:hypothetical protein
VLRAGARKHQGDCRRGGADAGEIPQPPRSPRRSMGLLLRQRNQAGNQLVHQLLAQRVNPASN